MNQKKSLVKFIQKRYMWFFVLFIAFQSSSLLIMFNKNKQDLYEKRIKEVSILLLDSISSPITQGSNLEAIQRLKLAQKKGLIHCFNFQAPFEFSNCSSVNKYHLESVQSERNGTTIDLRLYFKDNIPMINPIWYLFVIALTFLFFILFNYISIKSLQRKIQNDLESVLNIDIHTTSQNFFFEEIETISFVIKNLFQQKTKLETDKAVVSIAKKVAHDIRSPLSALEIISAEVKIQDNESDLLKKSIQRIRSIADDLLDYNKTSAPPQGISCVNESIDLIIEEKKRSLKNKKFDIVKQDLLNDKIIYIYGNDVRFKRVLSNLIDNSLDAGASLITLTAKTHDKKLEICIIDNGHGIPEEILLRLFQPEFQTQKVNGNGIGLNSCKEWMSSIGGDLTVQSHYGTQTSIILTFPAYKTGPSLLFNLSDYKNLIIADDEEYILDIWKKHLNEKQIDKSIIFCKSLSQLSSTLAQSTSPSLVFTDYNFQNESGNGLTVAERFSENTYILTTANYTDETTHQEANKILILPKPMITQILFQE